MSELLSRKNPARYRHDYETVQVLADFAAIAVRHQRQQEKLMNQAIAGAAAAMANEVAHQINNPLQSLTNILFWQPLVITVRMAGLSASQRPLTFKDYQI